MKLLLILVFFIRDFELIRQNDACDAATSSSQSLTDGTTACVPHAVVLNSYNCFKYRKNTDGHTNVEVVILPQRLLIW